MSNDEQIAALVRRIVDLEIKTSFQERTLEDLDAVLRQFTERVAALERELSQLRGAPGEAPGEAPTAAEVFAALAEEADEVP